MGVQIPKPQESARYSIPILLDLYLLNQELQFQHQHKGWELTDPGHSIDLDRALSKPSARRGGTHIGEPQGGVSDLEEDKLSGRQTLSSQRCPGPWRGRER